MYGKFFNKKAGFISKAWWPDFCNYRRSKYPYPADGSIEEAILSMLHSTGSLITREFRSACGFNGKGMRSKFDSYLTRLEMATYIVIEDFVYPHDKHNHEYGWGWSLLNTPEELYGAGACRCDCSSEASFQKIFDHLKAILPEATDRQLLRLIGWGKESGLSHPYIMRGRYRLRKQAVIQILYILKYWHWNSPYGSRKSFHCDYYRDYVNSSYIIYVILFSLIQSWSVLLVTRVLNHAVVRIHRILGNRKK